MYYIVCENVPGYIPEADSYITQSRESAADYALSLVDSYCDSLAEQYGEDADYPRDTDPVSVLEDAAASLADEFRRSPLAGPEWSYSLSDPFREHDLGLSVWINSSTERPDCDCGECEICED